jgi:penicillin-binding protein activator
LTSPRRRSPTLTLLSLCVLTLLIAACQTTGYTINRGDDPTLDEPAMSTAFDRRDLEHLFQKNMTNLMSSRFMNSMNSVNPRPTVAILPFLNDTSEHIGPSLQALLSKIETSFVNDGRLVPVASERRDAVLAELNLQQGGAFDPVRAAQTGRQLGAHYFITGKVYDVAERTSDMRRVQYFLFMQVINVETGVIEWQQESAVTKALVPL